MTIHNPFTFTMAPGSRDASDGSTAARHTRTLAILCVFLSALAASAASGQKLAITTSSPTPLLLPPRLASKPQAPAPGQSRPEAFSERCRETASLVDEKAMNFYLICVDVARHAIVTLSCKEPRSTACSREGDLLDAGRDFIVGVWTDNGAIANVNLGGVVGYSRIYQPILRGGQPKSGGAQKTSRSGGGVALQLAYFSPRKPGTLKLTVKVRTSKEDPIEKEYTIRAVYRLAIRLGLGISWAPWARKVDIQTAADGQRYAAVISGADGGLVDNELVAGISYFLWPVKQDSLEVTLAVGLRLGVVDIGSDGGWFQSLMVGPELAIGQDVAIGIFGGIRRTDLPDAGYEPGKLLLSGDPKIQTHFGVTPAFGLVLNFTPGFLDFFGVDK